MFSTALSDLKHRYWAIFNSAKQSEPREPNSLLETIAQSRAGRANRRPYLKDRYWAIFNSVKQSEPREQNSSLKTTCASYIVFNSRTQSDERELDR